MKTTKLLLPAIIAAFALSGTASAAMQTTEKSQPPTQSEESSKQSPLSRSEKHFLQSAAEINSTQVELGKLALKQSTDPKVRQIAEHLVSDHTQANKDLERLAASKGVKIDESPTFFQRRGLSSVQQTSGDQFNQEFYKMATAGHERAISLFTRASQRSQDLAIKEWAGKMLPALDKHMVMIRDEQSKMVGEKVQKKDSKQRKPEQY